LKRKTKRIVVLLVALCTAGGLGVWWKFYRVADPPSAGATTAKVVRRSLSSTVLATGAVKPQIGAEVKVGARISGRVEKLQSNIGDLVKKGQVLAVLEKAELEADVAFCQASLSEAETQLEAAKNQRPKEIARAVAAVDDAKASARYAQVDWRRSKELYEKQVAALNEVDIAAREQDCTAARQTLAEAALDLAKAKMPDDIKTLEATVESKKASLAGAKARRDYATIVAPISGVVASVSTQEGETVAAGLNAPTFLTIIDLGRLQVDTFVDEVDIGKVKVGQKATFTVDSFPSREFNGKVVAIYPKAVIQENVVNYDVVVEITDSYDGLLRPEMTASVTIQLDARENVLAVPVKAVKRERGKSVVYVLANGQPQPREVKVGWKDSQWVEIVSGLEEGQTVLLDAPTAIRPAEQ
jgi:HlyD family secretion protein